MLKKTVYFRTQEDLDKFNALKNKAEWLHGHLNSDSWEALSTIVDDTVHVVPVDLENVKKTTFGVGRKVNSFSSPELKLCKHGASPKLCKFAQPGKGCK